MDEDTVNVRLYHNGEFRKTTYSGGDSLLVPGADVDEFSYTVLMEYVKDYFHFSEIGGVYISEGKKGGWKLVTEDRSVLEHVNACIGDEEVIFYIDNIVDKDIDPLPQMQPHVVIRPRKNLVQVSTKKPQKRHFVTTHQLQQQQQQKKNKTKSPEFRMSKKLSSSPNMLTTERDVTEKVKGSAKRKLCLQEYTGDDEDTGENDIAVALLPPPPPLTDYEKQRFCRVEENNRVLKELGLKKMTASMKPSAVHKKKGKDKDKEGGEEYTPEIEGEDASDDTSQRSKHVKKKKGPPGPRTRSRANVATATENEPTHTATATEKEATQTGMTVKEVTSSFHSKVIKPTCSKLFKESSDLEAIGSLPAYLAMRKRQEHGLAAPTPQDFAKSNMEEIADKENKAEAPRKPRGPSKLAKLHKRTSDQRPIIKLNARGQPVSEDGKLVAELSRFLGTVAKDRVSLTYLNWHVVSDRLKQFMWDYTRERYIIPDEGKKWVLKTLNDSWRVHKSRTKKKHYNKYETDEIRIKNKPDDILLEDFKQLLLYWADEEVQSLAEDNAARRNTYTETHTCGPKALAQVRNKMKKEDPKLGSPSNAQVYLETRERKPDREYKSTTAVVNKKIKRIKKMISLGYDAEVLVSNGKSHGREWLLGRNGKSASMASTSSHTDPYIDDLTRKIRQNLESELEAKVNRKVQENMTMLLKKLGEANPDMKLDVGDFCATFSSDDDDNRTPMTGGDTS